MINGLKILSGFVLFSPSSQLGTFKRCYWFHLCLNQFNFFGQQEIHVGVRINGAHISLLSFRTFIGQVRGNNLTKNVQIKVDLLPHFRT